MMERWARNAMVISLLASACGAKPSMPRPPQCEAGQANSLGVGRPCRTHDDCRGLAAAMCPLVKGADRPNLCTMHCDTDEQCGPDAMCGLTRGWIRSCFPKRCTEFAYDSSKVKPIQGEPARHAGAIVHDAGVSFSSDGWGQRCRTADDCKGLAADGCNVHVYPPGVPVCGHECRRDARCGADAYCSYEAVRGFSLCLPRSPEPDHRAAKTQPPHLDVCKVAGTVADWTRNEHGIGKPCTATGDCGTGLACGKELANVQRRPDSCTRPCQTDADCGRNAICLDLDRGLSAGAARHCVPGCWAI
jgi:hypothetical protein